MNTNKNLFFLLFLLLFFSCSNQDEEIFNVAHVDTNFGKISFVLINDTPIHRDNFIQNANDSVYNKVLFHRIVKNFVVQTGNLNSVGVEVGETIPQDEVVRQIAAEKDTLLHHVRGAVAAARLGDYYNPEQLSSRTQFYIVTGGNAAELRPQLISMVSKGISLLSNAFKTDGGAPHLDGAYSIFGFVIDGMDVVDKMAEIPTGGDDRPIVNIVINRVDITQVKKSKIENLDIYKLFYCHKHLEE